MTKRLTARIAISVQPGASNDGVVGFWKAGVLRVRVKAPPTGGRANTAMLKLLAKRLGVPSSSLTILRGARSRRKLLAIDGISQAQVDHRLADIG